MYLTVKPIIESELIIKPEGSKNVCVCVRVDGVSPGIIKQQ